LAIAYYCVISKGAHRASCNFFFYIVQELAKARYKDSESIPNGAVNTFGYFHFAIGKAAMNAPRLWKLRKRFSPGFAGQHDKRMPYPKKIYRLILVYFMA